MRPQANRIAMGVVVSAISCASCRFPSSPRPQPIATGPAPRVVVATAWRQCGSDAGEPDAGLKGAIDSELPAILSALRTATGAQPWVLPGAKTCELQATLETKAPVPLVLVFIGHGILRSETEGGGSRLCLDDGPADVDKMLAFLHPSTPHAVLILDACFSADVDVRESPVPVSVISASIGTVEGWKSGKTALGGHLAQALERADGNRDEVVTDRELLQRLLELIGPPVQGRPRPVLRRQSWFPLTIGTPLPRDAPSARANLDDLLAQVEHAGAMFAQREIAVRRGHAGDVARRPSTLWYLDPELPDHVQWPAESAVTRDRHLAEALADRLNATRVLHVVPMKDYLHLYELPGDEFVGRFRLSELATRVAMIERGQAAWKASDGGNVVCHPGWAQKSDVTTVEGEQLESRTLAALPCSSETNTRQCFALTDTAPGGVK